MRISILLLLGCGLLQAQSGVIAGSVAQSLYRRAGGARAGHLDARTLHRRRAACRSRGPRKQRECSWATGHPHSGGGHVDR